MSEQVAWLSTNSLSRRFDVTKMTIWRWEQNARLNFPKPMVINGRKLYRQSDIEEWEHQRSNPQGADAAA